MRRRRRLLSNRRIHQVVIVPLRRNRPRRCWGLPDFREASQENVLLVALILVTQRVLDPQKLENGGKRRVRQDHPLVELEYLLDGVGGATGLLIEVLGDAEVLPL